jgi:L-glutamine-phosphate cytidylyltransferase
MTAMTKTYQAVILAAGRGSRMGDQAREFPKPLLPIGPRSLEDPTETNFLRRQVELLDELGVEQIVIVVGSLKELVLEAIGQWNVEVQTVVNPTPDIGTSGSLHSFQYAIRSPHAVLNGDKQTLLLDADIVYHKDALRRLLDAPARSSLLVCERFSGDGEEVLAYGDLERPRFLGKALTPALVANEPCLGEATGIVKLAPEDHALARETTDWLVGDPDAPEGTARRRGYGPAGRATEHEELTQRFMRYRRMRCVRFGEELPFMECDDEKEYRRVRESFYPRLLQLEAGTSGPR